MALAMAVPLVLGFAVALRCVWDFEWTGHGNPAPVALPKRCGGARVYRYVRNPMYAGFAAGPKTLVNFRDRPIVTEWA